MSRIKELFISMQEAFLHGADIDKKINRMIVAKQRQEALVKTLKNFTQTDDSGKEEFNPDNEKHVEIMQETKQAMEENSYGEEE